MPRHLAALLLLSVSIVLPPAALAQWTSSGVPVCTGPGDRYITPILVPDFFGGVIVVWQDYRSSSYGIYAQRLNSAGVPQWTPNGVLLSGGLNAQGPVAVSNNGGGVIVAWVVNSQTPNIDVYAQNVDGTGALHWGPSGVPVCQASGQQYNPAITTDGRDPISLPGSGAIVAWVDTRSGIPAIYAQSVVGDGTARWATDGVLVCAAPSWSIGNPVIATDGTGTFSTSPKGAFITWEDTRNGALNSDIYAQRLNGSGVAQWTANGASVCTAGGDQYYPKLSFVGSGNAIVAWADNRTGVSYDTDIYAQRVGVSGAWPTTDGVAVCSPPGLKNAISFDVISDLKGGGVFVWGGDGPSSFDVFAQRVTSTGSVRWTVNGVALTNAPNGQDNPASVSDGASGAIVAWDSYPDRKTIYAQRIDSSGVTRWLSGGVPLCIASGTRATPVITTDGAGGAIVAWFDARAGQVDIYAQHVGTDGGVVGVEPTRAPAMRLVRVSSQPARGPVDFRLELRATRRVWARILGVDGRLVRTLAEGEVVASPTSSLHWDLCDASQRPVTCGVYFLYVTAGDESRVQRIVALR